MSKTFILRAGPIETKARNVALKHQLDDLFATLSKAFSTRGNTSWCERATEPSDGWRYSAMVPFTACRAYDADFVQKFEQGQRRAAELARLFAELIHNSGIQAYAHAIPWMVPHRDGTFYAKVEVFIAG